MLRLWLRRTLKDHKEDVEFRKSRAYLLYGKIGALVGLDSDTGAIQSGDGNFTIAERVWKARQKNLIKTFVVDGDENIPDTNCSGKKRSRPDKHQRERLGAKDGIEDVVDNSAKKTSIKVEPSDESVDGDRFRSRLGL